MQKTMHALSEELLTANGFTRVLTFFGRWDDWYLKRALIGT